MQSLFFTLSSKLMATMKTKEYNKNRDQLVVSIINKFNIVVDYIILTCQ